MGFRFPQRTRLRSNGAAAGARADYVQRRHEIWGGYGLQADLFLELASRTDSRTGLTIIGKPPPPQRTADSARKAENPIADSIPWDDSISRVDGADEADAIFALIKGGRRRLLSEKDRCRHSGPRRLVVSPMKKQKLVARSRGRVPRAVESGVGFGHIANKGDGIRSGGGKNLGYANAHGPAPT